MKTEFLVRDLFRLSSGTTVLACEGESSTEAITGRTGKLLRDNEVRQSITLVGERQMLNQLLPRSHHAVETSDNVNMSDEEARSGLWKLLIDD